MNTRIHSTISQLIPILCMALLSGSQWALAQPSVDVDIQPKPHFVVRAHQLVVDDETGPDWWFSDEVITLLYTRQANPKLALTRKFDDLDSGESRSYGPEERCILPRRVIRNVGATLLQAPDDTWVCNEKGLRGPLEFTVTLYEDDARHVLNLPWCFGGPTSEGVAEDLDCKDDLIGKETILLSAQELISLMPNVGDTHIGVVTLGGEIGALWNHGEYRFAYHITRVEDRLVEPGLSPQ